MAQPSVASYFNNRKRAAVDEIGGKSAKVLLLDTHHELTESLTTRKSSRRQQEKETCTTTVETRKRVHTSINVEQKLNIEVKLSAKTASHIRRIGKASASKRASTPVADGAQPQIVKFFKLGDLSPKKKARHGSPVKQAFAPKDGHNNIEKKQRTPSPVKAAAKLPKDLTLDEIKSKLTRSQKIAQMVTSVNKLREGMDKLDQMKNSRVKKTETASSKNLKQFESIELEVPMSPSKRFTSPVKLLPVTPTKPNDIMTTPKKSIASPRKLLMSPPAKSPSKMPAYMRFQHLVESRRSGSTLPLPYKHRNLSEIFKAVDTVCAMFFNRKEKITFKKLKPAVQRMLHKNFHESHLAQIHHLWPEAYTFTMEKTRNYGSATKGDYYQLVIQPNVEPGKNGQQLANVDKTDILKIAELTPMNPLVMVTRHQNFQHLLLEKIKDQHDAFLKQLDPPMTVKREDLRRWHPEFDLEACPEVQQAELPQAPHEERFSSAQEILSTARNLFSCNTVMERALDRLETKKKLEAETALETPAPKPDITADNLLKGVPKSLLEKIRAKQAAKALDTMTRRPSQEKETAKYHALPELSRHLRNVYVTERKGVLPQETVLLKVQNSYRGKLTIKELQEHFQLLLKAVPDFLSLHDLRKTLFLKLNRDLDFAKVTATLEKLAAERAN